jgi:hypothetical protein
LAKDFTYQTDERGFKELLGSPALSEAMIQVGLPALQVAKSTAPKRTGAFARGFTIKRSLVPAGRDGELRAGAIIENSTPYGRYVISQNPDNGRSFMWSIGKLLQDGE